VIVCDPEIRSFKIESHFDFIMMGCDGIFDRLNNRDVVNQVWDSTIEIIKGTTTSSRKNIHGNSNNPATLLLSQQHPKGFLNSLESANNTSRKIGIDSARGNSKFNAGPVTIHQAVAEGVEMVLKQSAASRSLDNITVVILGFNNFEQTIQKLNEGLSL
jgi:serine/threonine protein phosphatase PrpC